MRISLTRKCIVNLIHKFLPEVKEVLQKQSAVLDGSQRTSLGLSCSRIQHRFDSVGPSSSNVVPTSQPTGNLVKPPTWFFRRTSAPRWAPFVVGVGVC
ncbi:hypothetical protein DPMN_119955 [Dreissena polymorpha]|uniref:Uncharacterized protein n=1 Tax=Dreissena polymorpha TaxID=45954 RepID=A0A9D4GK53_DREPO|nr:hypothetical protein DPMN_119955 [Dreissena polymorpha]